MPVKRIRVSWNPRSHRLEPAASRTADRLLPLDKSPRILFFSICSKGRGAGIHQYPPQRRKYRRCAKGNACRSPTAFRQGRRVGPVDNILWTVTPVLSTAWSALLRILTCARLAVDEAPALGTSAFFMWGRKGTKAWTQCVWEFWVEQVWWDSDL